MVDEINKKLYVDLNLKNNTIGLNKFNNTYYFLSPIFDIPYINNFKEFVGIYQKDALRKSMLEHCVYVLVRYSNLNNIQFFKIDKYLKENKHFKYTYYAGYNEGDIVCYVMQCNNEFLEDYIKLVEGNYSKVSELYKRKVTLCNFTIAEKITIISIVNKKEDFKEKLEELLSVKLENMELWSKFEPEKEIFRYGQY
jgi:hypothetical protein